MNKKLITLCTFIVSLFMFMSYAKADTCLDGKFECTKDEDAKVEKLTKYIGTDKNVVIPAEDGEYLVIVTSSLFQRNTTVESVKFAKGSHDELVTADYTMANFFYEATSLKSVDLTNLDTTYTTNMNYMFNRCSALTELDMSPISTENVTTMNGMFGLCYDLKVIDLSNFDTSKVEQMDSIFNSDNFEKIILGPKADLHVKKTDSAQGSSFGRGTWRKESDNKLYSALEISEATSKGKGAGTYTKVSSMSDEIVPTFNATFKIGNFTTITKTSGNSNFVLADDKKSLLYKIALFDGDKKITDESVTVLLKNTVMDSDGNKYDLEITFSNFDLKDYKIVEDLGYTYIDLLNLTDNGIMISNYTYDSIEDFESGFVAGRRSINSGKNATSYDLEMKVLDKAGNPIKGSYIFSAYDLDISAVQDTDTIYKYLSNNYGFGDNSEGVNLLSGYDKNTITLAKDTFLTKTVKDGYIRITGTRSDNVSEYSEFVVKAKADDFKFKWTSGKPAYTLLLAYYQPKSVVIENINTKKELLKDSKFEIYDSSNKKVAEWTTDGKEGNSFFLNPGKYTVKQLSVVDPYDLASETVFFVDIEDKVTVDNKSVEKIVIINDYEEVPQKTDVKEEPKEEPKQVYKCETKTINGKVHYFDKDGKDVTKEEYDNKCAVNAATGSFVPYITIAVGTTLSIGIIYISKKKNILKKI